MKKAMLILVLIATTLPVAGCVIAPYPGRGGGWCYWHPGRCY